MPIKIEPPVEKEFTLERTDKEFENTGDPTTIKVIQAREGGNIERMELWKRFERVFQQDGDTLVAQEVSPAIVKRKEVFLTLASCNIMATDDKPLFKFPLKENEFNKAWATLPPLITDEIYEKVLEMNPDWSSLGEAD